MSSPRIRARSRYGNAKRWLGEDHPETLAASRDLREEVLADAIKREADADPPLTMEQRTRLAALLVPVAGGGGDVAA